MAYIESLTKRRELRVFYPSISMEEALKNEPYLMRVKLPIRYQFIKVLQIQDPLAGVVAIPGVGTGLKLAYAFLVDPDEEEQENFYITSLMPDIPFPWHDVNKLRRGIAETLVTCHVLGITTHSGVPILHVSTLVSPKAYEVFEQEVKECGYRLVEGARYTDGASLINLYRSSASKVREQMAQPVQPTRQGVAGQGQEGPGGTPQSG